MPCPTATLESFESGSKRREKRPPTKNTWYPQPRGEPPHEYRTHYRGRPEPPHRGPLPDLHHRSDGDLHLRRNDPTGDGGPVIGTHYRRRTCSRRSGGGGRNGDAGPFHRRHASRG